MNSLLPTFFNEHGASLVIIVQMITVVGALYGFARFVVDIVGWLRRPRLKLYMSDDVWPVAEPSRSELAINIQFVVFNPGKRMAVLRRVEASLVRPSFTAAYPEKTFVLTSRRFIKGNPAGFEHTEAVFARRVPPKESITLAVQLRGRYDQSDSTRVVCFDWFPGRYQLHLRGLINARYLRLSPCSGFLFELNDLTAGQLSPTDAFDTPLTRSVRLMN